MPENSVAHFRSPAIDLVKGLAIVSVICLHSLSGPELKEIGALFHIWQAVPVFVFLLGLNGAAALQRRGGHTLRELYFRDYLAPRFDRVYVPFLIAFAMTVVLVTIVGGTHYGLYGLGGDLVSGELPIGGPGNYFIALLFQAVLLLPLLFLGLRRWPVRALTVCLAIALGYEILAQRTGFFRAQPFLYEACIARYLVLLAIGCLLAGIPPGRLLRSRWLRLGAVLSALYLGFVSLDPSAIPFGEPYSVGQAFPAALYPTLLVLLAMQALGRVSGPLMRVGVELGRASYHIFLLQITWFGFSIWSVDSLPALLGNVIVTTVVGVAFYEIMERVPMPSAARLLAGRQELLAGVPSGAPLRT
ncbi:MAG TPA: acyltransferase [Solirubrobacteraceae bacterium]|jgi:peptidoglycan/LPS O-acetylase OafA/YrhL